MPDEMLRTGIVSVILCLTAAFVSPAQNSGDIDPFTASFEENINMPSVSGRQHHKLVDAMGQLKRTLENMGYKVSTERSDEVVYVTIPCSELFAPNDTELKHAAVKKLQPLVPYVQRKDNYKVVVAVHCDDTGDAEYADNLTDERATAIDAFFLRSSSDNETGIIPYGLGFDEPRKSNNSMANRAVNRRVEIYFIPTKNFIDKSQR